MRIGNLATVVYSWFSSVGILGVPTMFQPLQGPVDAPLGENSIARGHAGGWFLALNYLIVKILHGRLYLL